MKRSHREEFETAYNQQLQQRPCIQGLHPTLDQNLTNVLRQEFQQQWQQQQQEQQQKQPKALNSPISKITIGDWSREAIYPDDIIMKCYFSKKKLVWEILDKSSQPDSNGNKLKRKIEINWSDLSSCQVHIDSQDNTGILQIKLKPMEWPTFSVETNQRPGKHTQWKLDQDFTTNRSASSCTTHTLYFASGELQRNLTKLLSGDRSFWSTLLPNDDSNNGPYLLPHPTHTLNVNSPNFNMERQQVPAANDDGREVVVLNSVAENNISSEANYWKGVLQENLMLQETTPQNMESLNLEQVLEDALKTSNPPEETLAANSKMMYLPQNNVEQPQISNTIINTTYPLRGVEVRSMIAQDPNLEVFTWINTSNTTINNDPEANSMMTYPPQNMEHSTQHVYDGRQVQNSDAQDNCCELINNIGYWNEDYLSSLLLPETQQGLSCTLQENLKLQDHENMQQNTEQSHWKSVYDQMPPLEPIPEAEMPDLEVISEDVFKTSITTTPQHHTLQTNLTETQQDLSQLPDLEVISEAVLNTSNTTTSPLDNVSDFPLDFDLQDPFFKRAF